MKSLETWYLHQTESRNLIYDMAQLSILQQLDIFITNFNNSSWISKLFIKQKPGAIICMVK